MDELVLVAPSSFDRPLERIDLRRRCPHGLADAVLGGLGELFAARGSRADAARALTLRRSLHGSRRGGAHGSV